MKLTSTLATGMALYVASALAAVCVIVATGFSTAASTPPTVTVCGTLQLAGVNVSVEGTTVSCAGNVAVMVTLAVGAVLRTTV